MSVSRHGRDTATATLLYATLTIALTWPLALGLARDVPGDFGDPLLNAWILSWDASHLGPGWWHANIFHPHPLSLAYSEHLLPQALQILPIYAITNNPILCYNLLFLSTFVLSGLGMFLFARELTGNRTAAIVAGVAYAFAPYRVASVPHLQVLSSAWMPFTLFGLRRFFATGRTRPLVGAAAAWIAQNLSCGYYLLFFSPVVMLYVAWEVTTRRDWTHVAVLGRLALAAAVVAVVTLPFLIPYMELRRLGFSPRSLNETTRFSADVYAYFTADPNLRVWGSLAQAWPKAEGSLFPGLTILGLAGTAIGSAWRGARVHRKSPNALVGRALAVLAAISLAVVVSLLLGYRIRWGAIRVTSLARASWVALALVAALLARSNDARVTARRWLTSPVGLLSGLTLFAAVMSLGPDVHVKGRVLEGTNLYALFYHFVPGFDGLRVPARFAMIVALGLSGLAGCGAAVISRGHRRRWLVAAAIVLIVAESWAVPIGINGNDTHYRQPGLAPLPDVLGVGDATSPVYQFVARLPSTTVLLELPLGEPAVDVRYMFYSTQHWKKLVNGYSGGAPAEYGLLDETLQDALSRPGRAWEAVASSGATHAIVHEASYAGDRGPHITSWLRTNGAREVGTFGSDRIFQLR